MRLQTMHLPAPADRHDFAIVIDQVDEGAAEYVHGADLSSIKAATGAKAVLIFTDTVEVV